MGNSIKFLKFSIINIFYLKTISIVYLSSQFCYRYRVSDPLDTSILVLQNKHRSHLVDSGQVCIWKHMISL